MGIRPGHTVRGTDKQPWARYSKKRPKQSFVKAMPHLSLLVYRMGDLHKQFEVQYDLCTHTDIQLRDNALEAARQAANKYLEKMIMGQYFFHVLVFPHNVIRENKMIAGAGADRLQKGMRASFGRATDRAARMRAGQAIFTFKSSAANRPIIVEAVRRARAKLSGTYSLREKVLVTSAPAVA